MGAMAAVEWRPSPNHGERAAGQPIDILLLHYTGMKTAETALDWLCNPQSRVSAHYLVFEDGRVVQMVDEGRRAWHAGRSFWAGERDVNSRSIGIEIANPGHQLGYRPFPDPQIESVIALCSGVLGRHRIRPERVLAHSDVAPDRKEDPGESFPWQMLSSQGVGLWLPPTPVDDDAAGWRPDAPSLRRRFRQYGYRIGEQGELDNELASVVTAFQRHFRQARIDGIVDWSTADTLDRLLGALLADT